MHIVITRRAPLDVPDGINISIFSLAQELIGSGHEVTMVSTGSNNEQKIRDLYQMKRYPAVVSLTDNPSIDASYGRAIMAWYRAGRGVVERLRPDLVIINGSVPFAFDAVSCTVSHDLEQRFRQSRTLHRMYKKYTYRKSHFVAATCTELRSALSQEISLDESEIRVIPTCFDLSLYTSKPLRERERAILHIGTVDYKNPLGSIRALARLRGDAKLYLTGKIDDALGQAIAGLPQSVQERIIALGYVSAELLRDLLGRVRAVSVPSDYVLPVASPSVIEGFASGTPVVGSTSISQDLLENGLNGFTADPNDDATMAAHFENLLSDDLLWTRIAECARKRAERFSATRVAQMYLDYL